ncbi:MAG: TIGR00266 family protein [Deltaproteobacteria bacterium]|nr:TIGR00266 family protein [Deltaproteobacteria bacterium]
MTEGIEYEFEVRKKPTFSYIEVALKKGQTIQCEGGTMIFFDPTLEISTKKASSGFLKSLKRVLAGETFLAPAFPGDLMHLPLKQNESWILFSGCFVASSVHFETQTNFLGLKRSFFGGERAFYLQIDALNGPGDLFVGSMGAFLEVTLEDGQLFNCDNGHLVAMESSVSFDIKKVGGLKSTFLSGEGVIAQLKGPGRVIMQSRNPREFALWLYNFMPKQNRTS